MVIVYIAAPKHNVVGVDKLSQFEQICSHSRLTAEQPNVIKILCNQINHDNETKLNFQ